MTREQDHYWLKQAIELSWQCPPSTTAFSVGAVIVSEQNQEVSRGYSRDAAPHLHAEESAIAKASGVNLTQCILYSSLEPCSVRLSGKTPCCQHITGAKISRVVFALSEPPHFVTGEGAKRLREQGIEVLQLTDLADEVAEINAYFLTKP